jgi:hypothetical protein
VKRHCTKCGTKLTARFCVQCGVDSAPKGGSTTCLICGFRAGSTTDRCAGCGNPLVAKPQTPATAGDVPSQTSAPLNTPLTRSGAARKSLRKRGKAIGIAATCFFIFILSGVGSAIWENAHTNAGSSFPTQVPVATPTTEPAYQALPPLTAPATPTIEEPATPVYQEPPPVLDYQPQGDPASPDSNSFASSTPDTKQRDCSREADAVNRLENQVALDRDRLNRFESVNGYGDGQGYWQPQVDLWRERLSSDEEALTEARNRLLACDG